MQLPCQRTYRQAGNWYVLDEEFPWDVHKVRQDIFSLIGQYDTTVIFCDTCEANSVLRALGEEEEEFLFPLHGYYHKECKLIFVFAWETYEQLLETLLHEFRHHMQFEQSLMRQLFHLERHLPYEDRWVEKDAKEFAREKMMEYFQKKE
ncbi:MAG: DUF3920 family protein [Ectobacillus sp.]